MNYNLVACIRHFIVRSVGSGMILDCLLGTTHTFPPGSLWPNNSATRLVGLGKPPVITNGKYCMFLQYNQQTTAYYCYHYHYHYFWMEWGRKRRWGEHGNRMEMADIKRRTKRRKIPDRGQKCFTKENWEEKIKRMRNRKETVWVVEPETESMWHLYLSWYDPTNFWWMLTCSFLGYCRSRATKY